MRMRRSSTNPEQVTNLPKTLRLIHRGNRYKIGDAFFHISVEQAQEMLEESTETLEEESTQLEEKLSTVREEMTQLKVELYARFGKQINLET